MNVTCRWLMIIGGALLFWSGGGGWSQEDPPAEPDKPAASEGTEDAAEELLTEQQKATKEVSLRSLREAEQAINQEREVVSKQKRRIEMLLEELKNQDEAISTKEESMQELVNQYQQNQGEFAIPIQLVQHYESRRPKVAAPDFIKLFNQEPRVAVALVKRMKKKKSAKLIDEVAELGESGKRIAATIHAAIGTGKLEETN